MASDLDLMIYTAHVFEFAVPPSPAQVSCAVKPGAGHRTKRVADKFPSGQLRLVQIAASDPGAANIKFAHGFIG